MGDAPLPPDTMNTAFGWTPPAAVRVQFYISVILKKNCLARRGLNQAAARPHREWEPSLQVTPMKKR